MNEDLDPDREIFTDARQMQGRALNMLKEILTNDRRWKGALEWDIPNGCREEGFPVWAGLPVCLRRDSRQPRVHGLRVTADDVTAVVYWISRVYGKDYREKDVWQAIRLTAMSQA
jgi:hypothetical protein